MSLKPVSTSEYPTHFLGKNMPCELDCLATYGCLAPVEPTEGVILTPFVEISFGNRAKLLMSGNISSPPDNRAAIKSFEFGFGTGSAGDSGIKVEIVDEGGFTYRNILKEINKSVKYQGEDARRTSARFGWIKVDCEGNSSVVTNEDYGKSLYFMAHNIETSFENGVIKLMFSGINLMYSDTRITESLGDESNKMSLKQALVELFSEKDPTVDEGNINFLSADGGELEFKNSDGGNDGPYGVWPCDQQNALAVARKWLSSVTTKNGKGILIQYDPTGPGITFLEDPGKNSEDCCERSVGTYIVNGGNCSPVISFTSNIKWGPPHSGKGGSAPGASGSKSDVDIEPEEGVEEGGPQTSLTVQQHEFMWRNPEDMAEKTEEGNTAQAEAANPYEALPGIDAELKIQGDPSFNDPVGLTGKWVSVIVINPFYIKGDEGECIWLARPICNSVLSNKEWMILGCCHQITAGSYVTTLKLRLEVPNRDIDASEPLGGSGCGTEFFDDRIENEEGDE